MRVHKLNNVEQAMNLLEQHKVYLFFCTMLRLLKFSFVGSGAVVCLQMGKGGGRFVVESCTSNGWVSA